MYRNICFYRNPPFLCDNIDECLDIFSPIYGLFSPLLCLCFMFLKLFKAIKYKFCIIALHSNFIDLLPLRRLTLISFIIIPAHGKWIKYCFKYFATALKVGSDLTSFKSPKKPINLICFLYTFNFVIFFFHALKTT